jgi:hypothetical protein
MAEACLVCSTMAAQLSSLSRSDSVASGSRIDIGVTELAQFRNRPQMA